jgi:hypothetical protein
LGGEAATVAYSDFSGASPFGINANIEEWISSGKRYLSEPQVNGLHCTLIIGQEHVCKLAGAKISTHAIHELESMDRFKLHYFKSLPSSA